MSDLTIQQKARLVAGATTWNTVDGGPGLPSLRLSDGPHGVRSQGAEGDSLGLGDSVPAVCFPPAVALGSTWNASLLRRVGEALGDEASGLGVQVLLGPGMNIKRSPLGGRNFEYLSEDPQVTGELAVAMVQGIQSRGVAATPKHFAVNNQENDRMRVNATVSERALREIYLAAFERVVRESAPWAFMSAYNRVNGVFASENRWLLEEVLREEWGFDGLVMSDWGAVDDPVAAVAGGLDLEMPPSGRHERIVAAVAAQELPASVLDTAIDRLRRLAERTASPTGVRDIEHAQSVALDAAREAITLLENDGLLPLSPDNVPRMLVVGEFARTPRFQGGGSSRVNPTRIVAPVDCLRELSAGAVDFEPGFVLQGEPDAALADSAVDAAEGADVIVAFLGLPDHAESEGFDRTDLLLPADQLDLLRRLKGTGAPIVVVLSNGAVVDIASWRGGVDAIVEGWLLGQEGGRAIAEVLFGITNPSGRLAESIPLRIDDTPSHLTFPGRDGQVFYGEDIYVGYRHYDTISAPVAYPFGFGLSYTRFEYEEPVITELGGNCWSVRVGIRNTGDRAGAEVVQLYVAPRTAISRPAHELRAFAKIALEPGEQQEVLFEIGERDLAFWNARSSRWQVAAGDYELEIGASSRDIRHRATVTTAGDGVVDRLREDATLAEWRENPVSAEVVAKLAAGVSTEALDRAPELVAMVQSVPVAKLTSWGIGLTEDVVREVVRRANAESEGAR